MLPRASLSGRRHFRIEQPHRFQRVVDTLRIRDIPSAVLLSRQSFVSQSHISRDHFPVLLQKSSFHATGLSTQLKRSVISLQRSVVSAKMFSTTADENPTDRSHDTVQPSDAASFTEKSQAVDNQGDTDKPIITAENNETVEESVVIDDPCWGSPTTCSLLHLLKLIKKHEAILYESPDYIVLRKPADLRMDGDYPATVHKLLTFWYPPPSLSNRFPTSTPKPSEVLQAIEFSKHDSSSDSSESFVPSQYTPQQFRLLERIASIPRHCDIKDNQLRPCHQLDYATSGVLLVARSKEAASRARSAFENRLARKAYTAVLLGHFEIPHKDSFYNEETIEAYGGDSVHPDHNWSYVTHRSLYATMELMEHEYRKARHRQNKRTFHGFLPASKIFIRWQDRQRLKYMSAQKSSPKHGKDVATWNKRDSGKWDKFFAEVDSLSELVKTNITNVKWDDLNSSTNELDRAIAKKFARAADNYNDVIRENAALQKEKQRILSVALPTLPTFFRVKEDPATDANSFYIFAPLAQDDVTNNFAMLIHPLHGHLCPHLQVGDPTTHEFKPSLTSCTLLHRTYIYSTVDNSSEVQKIPVTVVQMEPKTGRRHQLRIHSALLGHPIAGDATYCDNETNERTVVDRLCLHSLSLKIPEIGPNRMDFEVESESPFHVQQNDETSFVTIDPY